VNRKIAAVAALAGIGAFAFSGRTEAAQLHPATESVDLPFSEELTYPPIVEYYGDTDFIFPLAFPDYPMQLPQVSAPSNPADYSAINLVAFLQLIRQGESSDDYTALVGGGQFGSFGDHPAILGPWKGIRRADGRLTTAAGGYQITRTTWKDLGGIKKYGSFSPSAQDAAAIDLLKRRGAYDFVLRGNISAAVGKLPAEWEMFTQEKWNVAQSITTFSNFGGVLA